MKIHSGPNSKVVGTIAHSFVGIIKEEFWLAVVSWQEVKPNQLEQLEHIDLPLEKAMEELMDGDILVFQREEPDLHHYDLPTAKEYFRSVIRMRGVCLNRDQGNVKMFHLWGSLVVNF